MIRAINLRKPERQKINHESPEWLHDVVRHEGVVGAFIFVLLKIDHSLASNIGGPWPRRNINRSGIACAARTSRRLRGNRGTSGRAA